MAGLMASPLTIAAPCRCRPPVERRASPRDALWTASARASAKRGYKQAIPPPVARGACAASQRSASSAAMQPSPAAVTAWRNTSSATSPAANTPSTLVVGRARRRLDIAVRLQHDLAAHELGRRRMADGDEHAVGRQVVERAGENVPDPHAGHRRRRLLAENLLDRAVPADLHIVAGREPLAQDLLRRGTNRADARPSPRRRCWRGRAPPRPRNCRRRRPRPICRGRRSRRRWRRRRRRSP